jgi:hypothetical protein
MNLLQWGQEAMTARARCAVYTGKSSEEGLEQSFNSLDAQREACEPKRELADDHEVDGFVDKVDAWGWSSC